MQQGNISFPIEFYHASINGKKGNTIERLHTESPSEDAQGYRQQEDIQTEIMDELLAGTVSMCGVPPPRYF